MRRGGRPVRWLVRTVNARVMALLDSSLIGPRLGKAVTTVSYVGRRSGRTFRTPVAYRREGDQVTILVDVPDVKNWWRNFTGDGGRITLRLDGTDRPGRAVAHRSGPAWATVVVTLDPLSEGDHRRP